MYNDRHIENVSVSGTKKKSPRLKMPKNLKSFLRAPLGWILIILLLGSLGAEAQFREGHRKSCAAASMLLDRQNFREAIACCGTTTTRMVQNCIGYATPFTFDIRQVPPLDRKNPFIPQFGYGDR